MNEAFIVESCIYGYFTDPPRIAVWKWETCILLKETKKTFNILMGKFTEDTGNTTETNGELMLSFNF